MPTQLVELTVAAGVEYANVILAPLPTVAGDSLSVLVDAVASDPASVSPRPNTKTATGTRIAFRGERRRLAQGIGRQHRALVLRPRFLEVQVGWLTGEFFLTPDGLGGTSLPFAGEHSLIPGCFPICPERRP